MLLIIYAITAHDKNTPFPSLYSLVPTVGAALILLMERQGTWTYRLLANPLCIGIGLVSYSAYLWHQPLFAFARYLSPTLHLSIGVAIALIGATFVLAWATYKFVEQPVRDRKRFTRAQVFTWTGVTGSALVVFGLFATWTQGMPQRHPDHHRGVFAQFDDPGAYVRTAFRSYWLAEFDPVDARRKLLVVGDSYGEDMVDVIEETSLSERYQLSTFCISAR